MSMSLSEYAAIEAAVSKLGAANVACNFDLCRSLFHENAAIIGRIEEEATFGRVNDLESAISSQGPLPRFRNRMDILAFDDGIAVVRVLEEEVVGKKYANYLTLIKSEETWECVSMVYAPN